MSSLRQSFDLPRGILHDISGQDAQKPHLRHGKGFLDYSVFFLFIHKDTFRKVKIAFGLSRDFYLERHRLVLDLNLEDIGPRCPGGDIEAARPGFGQAGVYPFPVHVEDFHAFYPLRRAFHMEMVPGGIRVNAEAFCYGVGRVGQPFYLYFVGWPRFPAGVADGGMVKPALGRDKVYFVFSSQSRAVFVPLIAGFLV